MGEFNVMIADKAYRRKGYGTSAVLLTMLWADRYMKLKEFFVKINKDNVPSIRMFEKIGFKNVMVAKDFPKDDPDFDPDNLKYSCIRYIPNTTANAMGPSWTDPRSGEIVNASVLVYGNIIQLLNNWCFVQTAQLDASVRGKKLPDDVISFRDCVLSTSLML